MIQFLTNLALHCAERRARDRAAQAKRNNLNSNQKKPNTDIIKKPQGNQLNKLPTKNYKIK